MFSVGQVAAVRAAFAPAGYVGEIRTLPVDSEDERIFALDQSDVRPIDVRSLEQVLPQLLGRKVRVVESMGTPTVPFE